MKKYKNFMPIEIIEKFHNKNNRNNKVLIKVLLILNIICFPNTLKSIKLIINDNNIESKKSIETISKVEQDINKDNLYKILNYIDKDTIYVDFKNDTGTIEVKTKDNIFNIEKENIFSIHSINNKNKEKFILEVSL